MLDNRVRLESLTYDAVDHDALNIIFLGNDVAQVARYFATPRAAVLL